MNSRDYGAVKLQLRAVVAAVLSPSLERKRDILRLSFAKLIQRNCKMKEQTKGLPDPEFLCFMFTPPAH